VTKMATLGASALALVLGVASASAQQPTQRVPGHSRVGAHWAHVHHGWVDEDRDTATEPSASDWFISAAFVRQPYYGVDLTGLTPPPRPRHQIQPFP
jgi:hypothetical protein